MGNQKQLTKETLIQALDTINEQADKFIRWYIWHLFTHSNVCRFENKDEVYLPYFGRDEDVIFRLFDTFIKLKYPGYNIIETNKDLIFELIRISYGKGKRPGVVLQGPVGTGKTTLLLVWFEFRLRVLAPKPVDRTKYEKYAYQKRPSIIQYTPIKLRTGFFKEDYSFIENGVGNARKDAHQGQILFIDDFGLGCSVNYFGKEVNILEELIYARYDQFKLSSNFEFYATTNLRRKVVEEIFNPRVYSRVFEMASWEPFTGSDKRKGTDIIKQWPAL